MFRSISDVRDEHSSNNEGTAHRQSPQWVEKVMELMRSSADGGNENVAVHLRELKYIYNANELPPQQIGIFSGTLTLVPRQLDPERQLSFQSYIADQSAMYSSYNQQYVSSFCSPLCGCCFSGWNGAPLGSYGNYFGFPSFVPDYQWLAERFSCPPNWGCPGMIPNSNFGLHSSERAQQDHMQSFGERVASYRSENMDEENLEPSAPDSHFPFNSNDRE